MEKPQWRRRASALVVDSPHVRLRVDELELPDGTIVSDYYVRESDGFVVIFPLTPDRDVLTVRQYRYGSDAIHLELPAGGLHPGEDLRECAARELLEETGYQAPRWEFIGSFYAEPARGTSLARIFIAYDARKIRDPQPDPTEVLQVELFPLDAFRAMLADGSIDAAHVLVAGYRALDHLGML